MNRPATLSELRSSGYRYRPVKQELRENLVERLRRGDPLFADLVGYETTVLPQLVHGILAQHDLLLLGLRGQAKTRILRSLPELLDEWLPIVDGVELWDDPLHPQFAATRRVLEIHGDATPLRWLHRSERYHEKLATPDVTIADLLGEIDIVKHAEGRPLSDEEILHYGLVPRSNRAIFAINELPDLAPRIQVGLFNVLEERDVQIRGFPVRLNLDLLLVFSANPEDYTHRGRIVTPLKDRIGTVIRTHYPFSNVDAMRITRQNAALSRPAGQPPVELPMYVHEAVEELVRLARVSPHVNQQSGVSVRTSIAALEVVAASAEKRALLHQEPAVVPRVSDLAHVSAACRGKIELLLSEDESAEDKLIGALIGEAIKNVAAQYLEPAELDELAGRFVGGQVRVEAGDDVSAADVLKNTAGVNGLHAAAKRLVKAAGLVEGGVSGETTARAVPSAERGDLGPAHLASAVEFLLEAMHVHDKLSKLSFQQRTFYRK